MKRYLILAALLLAAFTGSAEARTYKENLVSIDGNGTAEIALAISGKYLVSSVTAQCTNPTLTSVTFDVKLDGAYQAAESGGAAIEITTSGDLVQVVDRNNGPYKMLRVNVTGTGTTNCTIGVSAE